jgi:hypothetical protein
MNKGVVHYAILLGIGFCILAARPLWAADTRDALQAASEAIRNQKRIYIENVMQLTPQERDAFWRVYADYESGLAKITAERIKLASDFLENNAKLTDAEALAVLDQKLRIDGKELQFKQSYVAKFKQILPGRKVVRFYQAENKFTTAATSELYRNIPVIQ